MRTKIWYLPLLFICALSQNVDGQIDNKLSKEDSLLVLKKVYFYDFDKNKFNDIDEMYLEDIWVSRNIEAKEHFEKAIRLTSAPINERMILASYFYHDNKPEQVKRVLRTCRDANDTTTVYNVMKSYRIKFSDFEISQTQLEKYCENCKYN